MDIYDYLKQDHEHVKKLFKQFENSKVLERKKQIAYLIAQELIVHAHSEQEIFYKALKKFELTKDDASHGQQEHKEIEDQIRLVLQSTEFNSAWIKQVDKLKDIVEHHINDEEGPMFTQAKEVLSQQDAGDLKEKMHYLKQYLLRSLEKAGKPASVNKKKTKKMATAEHTISSAHHKTVLKKHEPRPRYH